MAGIKPPPWQGMKPKNGLSSRPDGIPWKGTSMTGTIRETLARSFEAAISEDRICASLAELKEGKDIRKIRDWEQG